MWSQNNKRVETPEFDQRVQPVEQKSQSVSFFLMLMTRFVSQPIINVMERKASGRHALLSATIRLIVGNGQFDIYWLIFRSN